jgi:hypothetical protein
MKLVDPEALARDLRDQQRLITAFEGAAAAFEKWTRGMETEDGRRSVADLRLKLALIVNELKELRAMMQKARR